MRKDRFWYCKKKRTIIRKKVEVLKRAKKWTFFKGVSPWILSKNGTFSYRRFSQKSYQKKTFLILWKERNDFKLKKIKVLKRAKKWTFSKGVVHDFVQKSKFLLSVFFTEIMPEKIVFQYLWKKRMILSGKKLSFKKGQKMDISKVHGFCPKIEFSLIAVFHRNYVRKDPFWII